MDGRGPDTPRRMPIENLKEYPPVCQLRFHKLYRRPFDSLARFELGLTRSCIYV